MPESDDWTAVRERLFQEAARVLRDPDDAEDAAQEAALRAWRHSHTRREAGDREAWLATIARNESLRVASRRARVRQTEVSDAGGEWGDEDPALASVWAEIGFASLLAPLRTHERRLLELRYLQELSVTEIASRLAMPEGTVKVRLHRLRKRLRPLLEKTRAP